MYFSAKNWIFYLTIALGVLACYYSVFSFGFVWDDTALVLRDPFIRSWHSIADGFQHFLFWDATASGFYRPIQRLTYTLDYALFAFSPGGYHFTNVCLHVLVAFALFRLCKNFLTSCGNFSSGKTHWVALVSTLLWAVHPLHTSAVAYISGRADLLCAIFVFWLCGSACSPVATGTCLDAKASRPLQSLRSILGYVFILLAAFAAAGSKEIGYLTPIAYACFLPWKNASRKATAQLLACMSGVLLILFLRSQANHWSPPEFSKASIASFTTFFAIFGEYARLILAPWDLHMERQVHPVFFIPGLLLMTSLLGFVIYYHFLKKCPDSPARSNHTVQSAPSAEAVHADQSTRADAITPFAHTASPTSKLPALLAAVIFYLPISGLLPINAPIAEHWLYLPLAFLLLYLAALLIPFSISSHRHWKMQLPVAGFLLFLIFTTHHESQDWKDAKTFFASNADNNQHSSRMLLNQANHSLITAPTQALELVDQAILQAKPFPPYLITKASTLARLGHTGEALTLLEPLLPDPVFGPNAAQLAALIVLESHPETALEILQEAATQFPQYWPVQKQYIHTLHAQGQSQAAADFCLQTLESAPYRAEAWLLAAQLLKHLQKPDQARIALQQTHLRDVHFSIQKM